MLVQPSATFTTTVSGAPSGLVGTIRVRLTAADGSVAVAASTAGVRELVAGSGCYEATITAPTTPGRFVAQWDTGSVSPTTLVADDVLIVSSLAGPAGEPTDVPVSSRAAA